MPPMLPRRVRREGPGVDVRERPDAVVDQGEAAARGVFVVGGIRNVHAFDGVVIGEKVGEDLVYRGVVEWGLRAQDVLALLRHAKDYGERTSRSRISRRPRT